MKIFIHKDWTRHFPTAMVKGEVGLSEPTYSNHDSG